MPSPTKRKPRRRPFKAKAKKKNPNSLRRLMRLVREDVFDETQQNFGQMLNQFGNKLYTGKQSQFRKDTVKNLEIDRTSATYIHLERYAWSVGLPTGLFLVFSRLMSKKHNDLLQEITMLKAVIREISVGISRHTEFDKAELLRWGAVFAKHDERLKQKELAKLVAP